MTRLERFLLWTMFVGWLLRSAAWWIREWRLGWPLLALLLALLSSCARQEPRWDLSVPVEVTTCYPCWGERLACGPQVCLSGQYHAGRWVAQMRGRPTWQLDCIWRHEPQDFGRVTGAVCEPPSRTSTEY